MEAYLDNTAVMHSYMMSDENINTFRFSVTLKEEVNPVILQKALDKVSILYPLISARISSDKTRFKIVSLLDAPDVLPDDKELLRSVTYKDIEKYAMQVIYKDNCIAVEFFHSLTDGTGAVQFLKALVSQYIFYKYDMDVPTRQDVQDLFAAPENSLYDDCFKKHARFKRVKKLKQPRQLFAFPEKYERVPIKSTTFSFNTAEVKAVSKQLGCSVTELLSGLMFFAVDEYQKKSGVKKHRDISIMIPINLRPLFLEKTLRNFSLYATPVLKIEDNDTPTSFLEKLRYQMNLSLEKERLQSAMFRNVLADNMVIGFTVNFKRKLSQRFYKFFGGKTCMTISNMGKIVFPAEVEEHIESMDVILSPRYISPYNCGIITVGDSLHLNLSSNWADETLEDSLEAMFKSIGLKYDRKYY